MLLRRSRRSAGGKKVAVVAGGCVRASCGAARGRLCVDPGHGAKAVRGCDSTNRLFEHSPED